MDPDPGVVRGFLGTDDRRIRFFRAGYDISDNWKIFTQFELGQVSSHLVNVGGQENSPVSQFHNI